jgi:hypothetical protein
MRTFIVVLLLCCVTCIQAGAQGCSDAGFCTAGSLNPHITENKDSAAQTWVGAAFSYGISDFDVQVITPRIEVRHRFDRMWNATARVTMQMAVGDLTTTTGLSDIILTGACNVVPEFQVTVGTKIPLSDGNVLLDGSPLPMHYQPSLGTVDVIAGVVWQGGGFSLAAAMQQPLTQNKNTFSPEAWPPTSTAQRFHATNGFERRGDVLLRASYMFAAFEESFFVHLSALPIYHLGNDTYVDTDGVRKDIEGSRGLTFNAALLAEYVLSPYNRIELTLAAPLVTRTVRPDGLTRSILIGVEYRSAL